jgi:hypothetical protein
MDWSEGIAFARTSQGWVFPEPNVIVTRATGEAATLEDVNGLIDWFIWLARTRGGGILKKLEPPIVIHDWRSFQSVPQEVRSAFVERRKEITMHPKRLVVALAINPVLRMALRTVALGAQLMTHAAKLSIVDDPEPELAKAGVTSPDPLLHLRLREAWRSRNST